MLSADSMEAVDTVVRPVKDFAKDSIRLVKRCHKPDRKGSFGRLRFFFPSLCVDANVLLLGSLEGLCMRL